MAYDTYTAERIAHYFKAQNISFEARNMMGGRVFMVDNKMCCGIHYDKKKQTDLLMARIGEAAAEKYAAKPGCLPMDFTGRPMKGYVFISSEAYDLEEDLVFWLDLCLSFNPIAKASKKKK